MARVSRTTATHPGSFQLASKPPKGINIGGAARRVSNVGSIAPVIGGSARRIKSTGQQATRSAGSRQVTPGRAGKRK